eukprot:35090_1
MLYNVVQSVKHYRKTDPEFKRIWDDEFTINPKMKENYINMFSSYGIDIQNDPAFDDFIKYNTYWYGNINLIQPDAIYSTLSRINFGLPQNVVAIFGEETDKYVCILIATTNIKAGQELVIDYFLNLHKKKSLSPKWTEAREMRGAEFAYHEDENMRQMMENLNSNQISDADKRTIIGKQLYSNGMVVKHPGTEFKIVDGCETLNAEDCRTKKAIKRCVSSGDIFKIAVGENRKEDWMGKEYLDEGQGGGEYVNLTRQICYMKQQKEFEGNVALARC